MPEFSLWLRSEYRGPLTFKWLVVQNAKDSWNSGGQRQYPQDKSLFPSNAMSEIDGRIACFQKRHPHCTALLCIRNLKLRITANAHANLNNQYRFMSVSIKGHRHEWTVPTLHAHTHTRAHMHTHPYPTSYLVSYVDVQIVQTPSIPGFLEWRRRVDVRPKPIQLDFERGNPPHPLNLGKTIKWLKSV